MNRISGAALALPWITLSAACGAAEGADTAQVEAALSAVETASVWTHAGEMSAPILERDPNTADLLDGARAAYALRMFCPQLTLVNGVLTVDFGAGCQIGVHTVSGSLTLTSAPTENLLTLSFVQLSDGDRQLDGALELSAAEALATTQGNLTVTQDGTVTEHLFSGTLANDGRGVTVNGVASRVEGANTSDLVMDGVYKVLSDCYPSAGQITLERSSSPTVLVTFSASTGSTGEVEVQLGMLPSQTVVLPSCGP